jgi:hypothetical protein
MVDLVGEGIPNWIVAVTSVLTLGAAVAAGIFAAKAAHYTKVQAAAAHEQVRIGDQTLEAALADATAAKEAAARQREEADRAYRSFAETRLDPLAPVIFAVAEPYAFFENGVARDSKVWLEVHRFAGRTESGYDSWTSWEPVTETFEEPQREQRSDVEFRTKLVVTLTNVSSQIARIWVEDPGNGEFDQPEATRDFILLPGGSKAFVWTKRWGLGMLRTDEDIDDSKNWLFNVKFSAHDLGMNLRDTYMFNGDLRLFARDGSGLVVKNEPPFPWTKNVATPLPGRAYERLDAAQDI